MKKSISKLTISSALLFSAVAPLLTSQAQAEETMSQTTVTVTNENGESVSSVKVELFNNGKKVAESMSDANGNAIFTNLPDKVYLDAKVEGINIPNNKVQKGTDSRVYVESSELAAKKTHGVTFKAYILNEKYQFVKGKKVKLVDITNKRIDYATKTVGNSGIATFKNLPAEHNFAVFIDGKNQGYTIRGIEGSVFERTFFVKGKGTGKYNIPTKPAVVKVIDENGQPLKKQKVELYRGKNKVRQSFTKNDGTASFINKITVGTYYDVYVNNKKINNKFAASGENEIVYLLSREIRK
ncbi:hypothetical protein ACMGE7_12130 [Macrococcus equi]|uniref:hypothetical protein n=2 Tax=Macrococcus equi TaxID=3395462 RepID=UPI0039BDCF8B